MPENRRQKTDDRRQKAASSAVLLLGLCLSVLSLRVTYTEAPTAQTMTLAGSLTDAIYGLTLSGLLIIAFVGWLLVRFLTGRSAYRVTGMEVGLGLFVVAAVVSSIAASDKRAAITHATLLLAPICAALLLSQILDSPAKIRLVLIAIVALGIVSTYQCAEQFFISNAITIEQYEKDPNLLLGPLGIEPGTFQHFLFEHRLYSRGIRGFFTTSNSAASFAICAAFAGIALLVGKFDEARGRPDRFRHVGLTLVALVLIVAGLLLTQSKGGIAAFVAGLAGFGLLMILDRRLPRHRKRIRAILVLSLILCVAGAGFATVQYGLSHGRLPGGNSMLVRWQYWTASARMYADHPFAGVGPGNFSDHYSHYKPAAALESVSDPHNWPLSLILQYGPLGLVAFLTTFCLPLWRSILPIRHTAGDETELRPAPKTVTLSILLGLGSCLLFVRPLLLPTSGTGDPDVWLYEAITLFVAPAAAFIIGFFLVAAPLTSEESQPSDRARSALSASIVAAVLAVLLHNLIDFALFEPGVWMTFWILLACLAATQSRREPSDRIAVSPPTKVRWLATIATVSFLAAYVLGIWLPVCRTTLGVGQAQRAIAAGRYDQAHAALEEATRTDPLSPVAANLDGRLYLQQSEQASGRSPAMLEQAARYFREAVARSSADYKNYEKLAIVYSRLGKRQEAYDWYLKAARLYPGSERLWFELGRLAEQMGRPHVALGHYRKAVEIEDGYRQQFRTMYPDREPVVSRLGEEEYRFAQERIAAMQQ
jgi:O-antigen ligase